MTTPQGLGRLDPDLVASSTLFRVLLTEESLAGIRTSLNTRRAEQAATTDPTGVSFAPATLQLSDHSVPLRIYVGTAQRPAPAVVFFHSGALVLGNLDTDHQRCLALARDGHCLVISVDYPLAPEHPYPSAFNDCLAVTHAVFCHPEIYGVDVTRVAISGSSAGAGIAAAVALRIRDDAGQQPCFVLLHQPMLDDTCSSPSMQEFQATPGFDAESALFSWASYLNGQSPEPYASPTRASSLAGLPPTYICCSEVDPLRDEAISYAHRLVQAGVPTDLHLVAGTCHGFDSFSPTSQLSVNEQTAQGTALRRAFRIDPPSADRVEHA